MTIFDMTKYTESVQRDMHTMEIIIGNFKKDMDSVIDEFTCRRLEQDINYVVGRSTEHIDHVLLEYNSKCRFVRFEWKLLPVHFSVANHQEQKP